MSKKVLIIEDSDDIGSALRTLIELEGYEAILATRAVDGRHLARSIRPDLIIVDVRLPDGDGIELTSQLRAEAETSDTPIICVSSYLKGLEAEALDRGCDGVFSKTSFIETYRETLAKYLTAPD